MSDKKLSVRELVLLSLMAALIFGTKVVMAALPNIHLVGVLLVLTTLLFGWKALFTVFVYVMLEGLVFGFGIWWVSYLYIWPLLVLAVLPLRRKRPWVLLSLIAAVHGYLFGALCAIPFAVTGGLRAGVAYWVSGIPFDLIHGTANFILCLVLLKPLTGLLEKAMRKSV